MPVTIVPDVVSEQTVRALAPHDSARDAARLMTEHNVSAVIVVDGSGTLVGIVTERDLSRRVVAENLVGADVRLDAIMTPDPERVAPHDSAFHALARMRALGVRHLPVVDEGVVVGVVSIRDLQQSVSKRSVTL